MKSDALEITIFILQASLLLNITTKFMTNLATLRSDDELVCSSPLVKPNPELTRLQLKKIVWYYYGLKVLAFHEHNKHVCEELKPENAEATGSMKTQISRCE